MLIFFAFAEASGPWSTPWEVSAWQITMDKWFGPTVESTSSSTDVSDQAVSRPRLR